MGRTSSGLEEHSTGKRRRGELKMMGQRRRSTNLKEVMGEEEGFFAL